MFQNHNIMFSNRNIILALLFFHFVAAEIFLRFRELDVFSKHRVIFPKREFLGVVHRVLLRVIQPNARLLRHEPDQFALGIRFLCHNVPILPHLLKKVKIKYAIIILWKNASKL